MTALFARYVVAAGVSIALASPAIAQAEPVRITYAAPEGCPEYASLLDAVRERAPEARPAWPNEEARSFDVHVSRVGGGFAATVTVGDAAGRSSTRDLKGPTCARVVDAAALVTAIAIDPAAGDPQAGPPANARAPASAEPDSAVEPPRQAKAAEATERAPQAPSSWAVRLAGGFGVETGLVPDAAPSVHLAGEVAKNPGRLWSPSLRVSVERIASQRVSAAAASAEFVWTAARLEVAPLHVGARAWSFGPSAFAEVGSLHGRGEGITPAREEARPWTAVGVAVRGRWELSRVVFVDAALGARAPLLRERFYVQPGATVHEVPALSALASLSIGMRIL